MSNNKQQTAVEYFAKEIFYTIELLKKGYVNDQDLLNTIIVISDKAKAMHKEEMVDFGNDLLAQNDINYIGMPNLAEHYYNETYGGNK